MKSKSIIFSIILVLSLFLSGCGEKQSTESEDTLSIYTTIYPLEYFTTKIGGEFVTVTSVIPPGSDAHTFEPTAKTMTEIADADAFIYSGVGLEGFVDAAKKSLEKEKVTFIEAGAGIKLLDADHDHAHEEDDHAHEEGDHAHEEDDHAHEEDEHAHEEDDHAHEEDDHAHEEDDHAHEEDDHAHEEDDHAHEEDDHAHEEDDHAHEEDDHAHEEDDHDHNHGDEDPHVWIDPILSITLAENIKNALSELMPKHQDEFEKNFQQLKSELQALDQEFQTVISESEHKEILVSHAAYGYWEERYGLNQISVSGLSPTQEPSQKQLQTIIETAQEHNIKYVIFEENVTGKIAEVVQKEIGAEALTLHNLESLTEDDIKNNEDYFSLMRKNLETLKKALN